MARITHRETSLGGKAQIRRLPHSSQFPPTARPVHTESSSRWGTQNLQRTKRDVWSDDNKMFRGPQAMISIIDRNLLRKYYEKAFGHLQQTNCRILAKAYVKLVEPRKQVNYPYNGRKVAAGVTQQLDPEATKPPWWPPGVSHREPDHLPKAGKGFPFLRAYQVADSQQSASGFSSISCVNCILATASPLEN